MISYNELNTTMKLAAAVLFTGLLLALLVNGFFHFFLMMHDHCLGQVIYVTQKHMDISVEGCTALDLTLGFYTPIKASIFIKNLTLNSQRQ